MLFSHPGIKLIDHLNGVLKIGLDIFHNKVDLQLPFNLRKIEIAIRNTLFFHDIGKATSYFQKYLKESIENKKVTVSKELRNHSLISAIYAGIYTLRETESKILSLIVFESVKKHHGDLENFKDMITIDKNQFKTLKKIWESLRLSELGLENDINFRDIEEFIEDDLFWGIDIEELSKEYFFLLNFIFSILVYSDKTEVKFHKNPQFIKPIFKNFDIYVKNYKALKFNNLQKNNINTIREEIFNQIERSFNIKERIFSLNVPTGLGKTLSVLNIAFSLLSQSEDIFRIIYALPFTSIVDQTAEIIKEILENNSIDYRKYLTIHHHLVETNYKILDDKYEWNEAQFLIESWDDPFIVTTFWQLFNSVLTNKNSQLRKFHNLANSIIILDEIQTIPYIYWDTIKEVLLNLCSMFNTRVILMTATMPMIFDEKKREIYPLIDSNKRKKYFNYFSRYKVIKVKNLDTIYLDELTEIAIGDIKNYPDKDFLFVFNTIKSSVQFFRNLKDYFQKEKIIYLSSNIVPIDRRKRITEIKKLRKRKIVVSTQLVEAGVDIDFDIVYRDFSPLDNIIQTAGRCNRNNRHKGILYLFMLKRDKNVANEDVYYIYPKVSIVPTKEIFFGLNELDEKDLLDFVNNYYKKIKDNMSTNESHILNDNINQLEYENISNNFQLIKNIYTENIFIEKDERATKILNCFKEILNIDDRFKRKNEFLKIKKDFYDYTLSIKTFGNQINFNVFKEIGHFKILPKDMILTFYDDEIGFVDKTHEFL